MTSHFRPSHVRDRFDQFSHDERPIRSKEHNAIHKDTQKDRIFRGTHKDRKNNRYEKYQRYEMAKQYPKYRTVNRHIEDDAWDALDDARERGTRYNRIIHNHNDRSSRS